MWIIKYKNKPVTVEKLYQLEGGYNTTHEIDDCYVATRTKKQAVQTYLRHFGYTWKERIKGIEVCRV